MLCILWYPVFVYIFIYSLERESDVVTTGGGLGSNRQSASNPVLLRFDVTDRTHGTDRKCVDMSG